MAYPFTKQPEPVHSEQVKAILDRLTTSTTTTQTPQ